MSDLIIAHSGGTPTGFDVTHNGTLIAAEDFNRTYLAITNPSDTGMYLALKTTTNGVCTAVNGSGIYLAPLGGSYEINTTNRYYGEVWAIHNAVATKRICLQPGK
jgi:hypothetical protein